MNPKQGPGAVILAYHSQNVGGSRSPVNDHHALAADLEALTSRGLQVISLHCLLDIFEAGEDEALAGRVCLTFDDGCDFDVRDIDFPGFGRQRSFLGIMEDFIRAHGNDAQSQLHATSFVIASPEARRLIDGRSLFGRGWISDGWWADLAHCPLLSIGNHGWDHNHPDLDPHDAARGGFVTVETLEQCREQVVRAARSIERRARVWPDLFAYPFGESSEFIREEFFPGYREEHRCRAALGADPGFVTTASDRWNLPRFVCGRDWHGPEELLRLMKA